MNKKIWLVAICLLAISGIAFANFTADFQINFPDIAKYFQVLLSGNQTQNITTTSGTFKYFSADGNGFVDTQSSAAALWDGNCIGCQVAIEAVSLTETACDVKTVFDGKPYDLNMQQPKQVFLITANGQRLSIGALMNAEGQCKVEIKDLNVLVP
ncbi:MAG: hypothetical protein EPO20_30520 [Betaproteobacteria bacterium]|nr:MAG: hypothetical protein EPO20_30520 [Betaproteobacteria bacterium]